MKGRISLTTLAIVGIAGYFLFFRGKRALSAQEASDAGILDLNTGRVVTAVPGVTHDEQGTPTVVAGESSASIADRFEAWGMQTGQAYPTLEGYGAASPIAADAFRAQVVGPQNDHWTYAR